MTEEEAERIYALGREAVIFTLLRLAAMAGAGAVKAPAPLTPSGMVPPQQKPKAKSKPKKPGAKKGHPGSSRPVPEQITHEQEHPALDRCPDCGAKLGRPRTRRFRLIEDIVEHSPEVTRHCIPRSWCSRCKKYVEPPVVDAMAGARIGHRTVALSSWLHYGLGNTTSQILSVLNHHLHFQMTAGGLVAAWQRMAEVFQPWYEQIAEQALEQAVLSADETGWRLSGETVWLWCFTAPRLSYYMIDRSRGRAALDKFFTRAFDGILVTDFWAAYDRLQTGGRQTCLAHLLRELKRVDKLDSSEEWASYRRKVRRLLRDALRWTGQSRRLPQSLQKVKRTRLHRRLKRLGQVQSDNKNVRRIAKRLVRHQQTLLTFLDHDQVPSDNNRAEREIRPAVIMRKNSLCNRSENGAQTQAILMSIHRTLKLRGCDPMETIVSALQHYVRTKHLPQLPNPMPALR